MKRRSMVIFVLLNIVISLAVVVGALSVLTPPEQEAPVQIVTVEIRITNTPNPNRTPEFIVVTATPGPGEQAVAQLPTGIFDTPEADDNPLVTLDLEALEADESLQGTATALPENCIIHTVKAGDTPFGIAEQYGADGFDLMVVNGFDETAASTMQIGDVVIVPLEGCNLSPPEVAPQVAAADATEEATLDPEATVIVTDELGNPVTEEPSTPTLTPTLTLPPTAVDADVTIEGVISPGDVTAESVEIENIGETVNIDGWTLSDSQDNVYTFSEQRLFSGGSITINTRAGTDTPVALFWGLDEPVWEPGDVVTLTDADGNVQSSFRVPDEIDLE